MSGFGSGGFGGGSGFGTPNQGNGNSNSNSSNPFGGGGFGNSSGTTNENTPGRFGSSTGAPPFGGGSGGFGGSNNSNSNPNPSFGSSPTGAPFGRSTAPSSFGNINTGGGMSFGTSPNVMVGTPNNNSDFGGGGNAAGAGFGGGRPTFGQQLHPRNQQGNNKDQTSSSFNNPFGGSQSQSQSQPQQSFAPFAGSISQPQQSSGVKFGTSSNVVVDNSNRSIPSFGGRSKTGSSFGRDNTTTSSGFGKLGGSGNSNENPFGSGAATSVAPRFGGGGAPLFSASTISTIPERSNQKDTISHNQNTNDGMIRKNIDSAQAKMEEKKRILKAKIEEKKRKLLERQQKKKEEEETRSNSPTPVTFPTKASHRMNHQDSQAKPQTSQDSLAERNALRFAKHHKNQASVRSQSPVPATTTGNSKERETLEDAVNLIGLCPTMCPADELERRRNESDIQALEIPLPGGLHPSNWTFKETAIKRFRRSAADYKLDVPEWVRPPEVLERTLGYLEEWIMERDRQGPDPRFPRKDVPPPPLDVYQFIWDRTRMIRKDFILQNYVGTGGRCDAKAVRCHERIARWHALCEHQLSHIEDFVKMQSQQNMQELGQTMKTLNSFYDDALDRSTKEVPDERSGSETFVPDTNHTANSVSDKNKAARGGCLFDVVQGQSPMDYNGQLLNNAKENPMVGQRLVGNNNNKTMARGTAEPEMRGIYMLLTMENEGGMEVLKYAAKLFKERPRVYHSPPVQLALTIFKAIKDMNYVKFFSILRSSSTPYLFSCIMFKQVEIMRRIAIQIMSISYGARNKNTGEAMYDLYPLDRLLHVLCFEDLREAKKTCEFYNITVKECTSQRTGEVKDVIFWKGSKFRVPKDAEKGHVLHLKPQKMIRTIECKLNGATRLAICRGEVSGKGAASMDSAKTKNLNPGAVSFIPSSNISMATMPSDVDSEAEARELLIKKKLELARRNQLAKQQKEMERQALETKRISELQQREDQRKKELKEKERQVVELEKRRRMKLQEEKIQQRQIEKDRLKKIKEEALKKKIKEEKDRKDAEEVAKRQREIEEQIKRDQEEKERLELEHRIAEEKRLKELEEEERRRRKEEERRREILRLEREARRKREAEEKRKADEWQNKIDAAARVLMWHRWKRALSRPLEISIRSQNSLREIDLSFRTDSFRIGEAIMQNNYQKVQAPLNQPATSKTIIENLLRNISVQEEPKLDIANMALKEIGSISENFVRHAGSPKSINLLKIALICPETMDITDQSYASLVYHWIGTRVNLGKIEIANTDSDSEFSSRHEVRALIVRGSSYEVCSSCDIALFVIPPHWSDRGRKARILNDVASSLLDESIPRVALAFNDGVEQEQIQTINNVIAEELGGNMGAIPVIQPSKLSPEAFEGALKFALRRVAKLFIHEACVSVVRIPVMHLATKVVLGILWQCIPSVRGEDIDEDAIVEYSRLSLRFMMEELATLAKRNEFEWSLWPAPEFSPQDDKVKSYFSKDEDLPLQWTRCLGEEFLQETYQPLLSVFRGHFRDVYQRIVVDAPIIVQDDCASECAQGQYRRCLQKALVWMQEDSVSDGSYIYLPEGKVDLVVKDVAAKVKMSVLSSRPENSLQNIPRLAAEDESMDNFVFPKKIDYSGSSGGDTATTTRIDNGSFLLSNKRSRSLNQPEHAFKKKRREGTDATDRVVSTVEKSINASVEVPVTTTEARLKNTLSASKAYTKKLERLLSGDETIELTVGNTLLSRYLRDVPKPQV